MTRAEEPPLPLKPADHRYSWGRGSLKDVLVLRQTLKLLNWGTGGQACQCLFVGEKVTLRGDKRSWAQQGTLPGNPGEKRGTSEASRRLRLVVMPNSESWEFNDSKRWEQTQKCHPPILIPDKKATPGPKYTLRTLLIESNSERAGVFPNVTSIDCPPAPRRYGNLRTPGLSRLQAGGHQLGLAGTMGSNRGGSL